MNVHRLRGVSRLVHKPASSTMVGGVLCRPARLISWQPADAPEPTVVPPTQAPSPVSSVSSLGAFGSAHIVSTRRRTPSAVAGDGHIDAVWAPFRGSGGVCL